MPLIEELPVTAIHRPSHGWTYVPDVKAQSQPMLEPRKRGGRKQTGGTGELSAKQQKAIQIKLNELDKENYKDAAIAIPTKSKERTGGTKKMTPNVRRILTYQRTFAHYLADEEAQISQNQIGNSYYIAPVSVSSRGAAAIATKQNTSMPPPPRPGSSRKSSIEISKTTPNPKRRRERSTSNLASTPNSTASPAPPSPTPNTPTTLMDIDNDPTASTTNTSQAQPPPLGPQIQPPSQPSRDSTPPFLLSRPRPKPPSSNLLAQLLSEPPLSFSASRAQPVEDDRSAAPHPTNKHHHHHLSATSASLSSHRPRTRLTRRPQRYFCALCGYWGKVKCKGCGERTCGLMECWKGHVSMCDTPT